MALRRERGGNALVVVTGVIKLVSLPEVGALRRRFDQLIMASLVPRAAPAPTYPGFDCPGGGQRRRAGPVMGRPGGTVNNGNPTYTEAVLVPLDRAAPPAQGSRSTGPAGSTGAARGTMAASRQEEAPSTFVSRVQASCSRSCS